MSESDTFILFLLFYVFYVFILSLDNFTSESFCLIHLSGPAVSREDTD